MPATAAALIIMAARTTTAAPTTTAAATTTAARTITEGAAIITEEAATMEGAATITVSLHRGHESLNPRAEALVESLKCLGVRKSRYPVASAKVFDHG